MKITNVALLFIAIIIPFVVRNVVLTESLEQKAYNKLVIDGITDTAIDDAIDELVIRGAYNQIVINKEGASSAFFNTLYINFGATYSDTKQAMVDMYVPILVVVDYDGYYTLTLESYTDSQGMTLTQHIWSEKIPYVYEQGDYIYGFTLDDHISIYDTSTGEMLEGSYNDFALELSGFAFESKGEFELKRQEILVASIENEVKSAINNHNAIASRYGVTYEFYLPVLSDDTWNQCIEDVSLLAFVQGIPMGMAGDYYNQYALGGSMVKKRTPYYISIDIITGRSNYHREDCSQVDENALPCLSREAGAKQGAIPCEACKP
jgi:hypothetical protein